jgi:hypothetical protein
VSIRRYDGTTCFSQHQWRGTGHDADTALNAATQAGASYCDVRIGRYLNQFITTRDLNVENVTNTESAGVGVRVVCNGAYGFAATSDMSPDSVAAAARQAVDLLTNSNALLDWQVTLGKTVTRSETARAAMPDPNLLVVDAAYFERLHDAARTALLAQVAQGTPLIILAASATDTGVWSRALQLDLRAEPENRNTGAPLAMSAAPFNPAPGVKGAWSGSENKVWTRSWRSGRIVWLGVSDWHRYAISEPQALGLWWQDVLDQAGIHRVDDVVWQAPDEMPLPGQRLEVCKACAGTSRSRT